MPRKTQKRKTINKITHSQKNKGEKWRMYFKQNDATISPIHDIKLFPKSKNQNIVNMIVEIPRGQQAKLEMATKEKYNPIKHDVKNGKLRYVYYPYPFNYGALPQTWEDTKYLDHNTNALGDGDPIDACEIGSLNYEVGEIIQVKILGVWAMIDEGQTDWKVLVINVKDPLADKLNDMDDVNRELPGVIDYSYRFLRDYKIPTGAKPNEFAFDGNLQSSSFACEIVKETHSQWKKLFSGERLVTDDEIWIPKN